MPKIKVLIAFLFMFFAMLACSLAPTGTLPDQTAAVTPDTNHPTITPVKSGAPTNRPATATTLPAPASAGPAGLGGCAMFPPDNAWNTRVDNLPVDPRSEGWLTTIGKSRGFHMDFGSGTWQGHPIGIPYNLADASTPKFSLSFEYQGESDPGPYPIINNPLLEGGSDSHMLTIDKSTCTLYEIYAANNAGGAWAGGSGAIWKLDSNALRPAGWTSADAAGLPILAGLVRFDEVASGHINHALRFTAASTKGYIWPARHQTTNKSNSTAIPPMGARFRLKASFDISSFSPTNQVILQAMKTYGIILADNGSNWFVTGVPDPGWNNDDLHAFSQVKGTDFEAVDTSQMMIDPNSGAARTP